MAASAPIAIKLLVVPAEAVPAPLALKLLLDPAEAAKALSIDRSTLYALLMDGRIASFTVGRARRIPVSALEAWIARELGEAAPATDDGGDAA
jgi:excisionase family DNA binding protein